MSDVVGPGPSEESGNDGMQLILELEYALFSQIMACLSSVALLHLTHQTL